MVSARQRFIQRIQHVGQSIAEQYDKLTQQTLLPPFQTLPNPLPSVPTNDSYRQQSSHNIRKLIFLSRSGTSMRKLSKRRSLADEGEIDLPCLACFSEETWWETESNGQHLSHTFDAERFQEAEGSRGRW